MAAKNPARRKRSKSARLEARISSEQKAKLARAAELRGQSLTEFLVTSAEEAATRAIRDHEVIDLSARDREAFAAALLAEAPEPGERLRAAAKRYRKRTGL